MNLPRKAYEDVAFLKSDACRAQRLELEFLKADVTMRAQNIKSTIVLFGSARVPDPTTAQARLQEAAQLAAARPGDPAAATGLRRAQTLAELSGYYTVARDFAALVSRCSQTIEACHFVITTGGGGGFMEAGNRGAAEVGAKSIGLNISLPHEQEPNRFITPELIFQFHYFSIRKLHFLLRARGLCVFPGGFGTLDELFEVLTLIQTRKIRPIPVVLFGRAFWEKLINWEFLADQGLINPDDQRIFRYCETAHEAWEYICSFWGSERAPEATVINA
ncbi:MAG: LOG family protein [Lentisphaeria bacterium]